MGIRDSHFFRRKYHGNGNSHSVIREREWKLLYGNGIIIIIIINEFHRDASLTKLQGRWNGASMEWDGMGIEHFAKFPHKTHYNFTYA